MVIFTDLACCCVFHSLSGQLWHQYLWMCVCWVVFSMQDILIYPPFRPLLQSSWQTRRFRGRRTWYWRGKRRRRPGRRWGHVWMRSRPGSSPVWWKLTTRPMMPPILTSPASGLVQNRSFFLYQKPHSHYHLCSQNHFVVHHKYGWSRSWCHATEGRVAWSTESGHNTTVSSKKLIDTRATYFFYIRHSVRDMYFQISSLPL